MRRLTALLAVGFVLLSSIAGPAVAAETPDPPDPIDDPDGINFGSDVVQNPEITTTVTKDVHRTGWNATEYEGDSGEIKSLAANVNESAANPYTLVATDIEAADFGEFPRKSGESNNTASALDASEWTKDLSGSAGTGSIADVTTAPSVEAVSLSTSSQASGDVAVFTYSNFSITSDEDKRYLQLAADVNTLDAGAHVEVRVVDEDGDYKNVVIDPDNSTSADDVLANSTATGAVLQQQLGTLATEGSGDGSFDNIQKVVVRVADADADVAFSLINAEKMGAYSFGEQAYDEDDDGEKDETRTLTEPNGEYSIMALDSLGSSIDAVHNMDIEMRFPASALEKQMDADVEFSNAGAYPSFDLVVDAYYRLQLPSAYDLSYASATLTDEQQMPSGRYQAVEIAEGVGDTNFGEIDSWSAVTGSYDSQGATVTLDSTIQPGSQIALHFEYVVTQSEYDTIPAAAGGGVAGPIGGGGSGGIVSMIFSLPGMIVTGLLSFLGGRAAGIF